MFTTFGVNLETSFELLVSFYLRIDCYCFTKQPLYICERITANVQFYPSMFYNIQHAPIQSYYRLL